MTAPTLPPWHDAMSDGCSVPAWLRFVVPLETPAQQAICREHDEAYYYGGTEAERLAADLKFAYRLVSETGMDPDTVMTYFNSVRVGGHPKFRIRGVSWAFGGERFCYGERAVPAEQ